MCGCWNYVCLFLSAERKKENILEVKQLNKVNWGVTVSSSLNLKIGTQKWLCCRQKKILHFKILNFKSYFKIFVVLWCGGYHYCTTSFNKAWTQVMHRFNSCLRHVRDSQWWQWSQLEIRLNAFCWSTIPHKQIIKIIIIIMDWRWENLPLRNIPPS